MQFLIKTDDAAHNDAFVMDVMRDMMVHSCLLCSVCPTRDRTHAAQYILDREARGKWWMKPYQVRVVACGRCPGGVVTAIVCVCCRLYRFPRPLVRMTGSSYKIAPSLNCTGVC